MSRDSAEMTKVEDELLQQVTIQTGEFREWRKLVKGVRIIENVFIVVNKKLALPTVNTTGCGATV